MQKLQAHLRNKLLAGALAAAPLVALIWGAIWLEENTRAITQPLGVHFPGLGVLLIVVGVYLLGLAVTSLFGKLFLRLLDGVLLRVPGLGYLYRAWKDVVAVPTSKEGVFDQVVLLPNLEGRGLQLGFCSREPIPGDERLVCVFLPGSPNPVSGRLVLVDRGQCLPVDLSLEDAFKFLLSTGNYVPAGLKGLAVRVETEKR